MDNVSKYSKEWFASHATTAQKAAAKKIETDKEIKKDYKMRQQEFVGNKGELIKKFQGLKDNPTNESILMEWFGGAENFLNLIDTNNDNVISADEIASVAAISTEELAESADKTLSVKDLQTLFQNVMAADGATVTQEDNVTNYEWIDGTSSKLTKDSAGKIVSKTTVEENQNNETITTNYDYNSRVKVTEKVDAQGRQIYYNHDAPGRTNDVTIETTYESETSNAKKVVTTTAADTTRQTFGRQGNLVLNIWKQNYSSDGVIGDTEQKSIGDCWVLSSVNSLRSTEKGAQILKDAIQHNPDGTITVKLKGVGKEYTYTPNQIGGHDYKDFNKEFSSGDIDMNLIEMAIADYRSECIKNNQKTAGMVLATEQDPLDGGFIDDATKYLTGLESEMGDDAGTIKSQLNNKQKKPGDYALTVQFTSEDSSYGKTEKGKPLIVPKHAYAISRVTKDTVFVVNPWDSSKEISYPKDEFVKNVYYTKSFKLE